MCAGAGEKTLAKFWIVGRGEGEVAGGECERAEGSSGSRAWKMRPAVLAGNGCVVLKSKFCAYSVFWSMIEGMSPCFIFVHLRPVVTASSWTPRVCQRRTYDLNNPRYLRKRKHGYVGVEEEEDDDDGEDGE
eukprot:11240418-Prorocentrum_lima.AAC.1